MPQETLCIITDKQTNDIIKELNPTTINVLNDIENNSNLSHPFHDIESLIKDLNS